MERSDLRNLRTVLTDRRARVIELQRSLAVTPPPRALEAGVETTGTGTAELKAIDRALERLDAGTYEVCEGCGDEIPVRRLASLPWATLCPRCTAVRAPATPRPAIGAGRASDVAAATDSL